MNFEILFVIILTIILMPSVHLPLKLMDGYILPQMGIGAIGISLALILFTISMNIPVNLTILLALLFFGYLILTTGWSTVSHSSARDFPLIFLSVFGFIITSSLFDKQEYLVLISLAVFFISNLLAFYAIGQRFCFDPFFPERLVSHREHYEGKKDIDIPECFNNKNFQDSRAIGTIGNTNFSVGYFLSSLPFLIYLCFTISPWFILSLIPIIGAIIAARCRAGYLGLITGSLFFILILSKTGLPIDWGMSFSSWVSETNIRIGLSLIILIIVLTSTWMVLYSSYKGGKIKRLLSFFGDENDTLNTMLDIEGKGDNSLEDRNHPIAHLRFRLRYWKAAIYLIRKKFLQGHGLRTYRKDVYQAQGDLNMQDHKFLGPAYQTPQPREVHNDFLENFVEGGLVGGGLFIVILGIVLYHAYCFGSNGSLQDLLMIGSVVAGLIAILVDVFFFFPLRIGPSAMLFWVSLGLIEGITGNIKIVHLQSNAWITIFISLALIAMLWETVIKPNLGNYYFSCYNFSTKPRKKEQYLIKAVDCCPRETIFRIHMMIGYMNTYIEEASQHMEVARHFYDGMIPAWALDYNNAVIAAKRKNYEESLRHLQKSLFYLPSFEESRGLFQKIWPLAPFKKGRINLKQISQEVLAKIKMHQTEIRAIQMGIQQHELSTQTLILAEKGALGVPTEWLFDGENNVFIPPDAIPPGKKVVMIGPANLPVLVPENAQVIAR